jgi:hypothetical protein
MAAERQVSVLPLYGWNTPMRRFNIHPTDAAFSSVEVIAHEAAAVLNLVHRIGCNEADVQRDGIYVFSVRLERGGFWCISQRSPAMRPMTLPQGGGQSSVTHFRRMLTLFARPQCG